MLSSWLVVGCLVVGWLVVVETWLPQLSYYVCQTVTELRLVLFCVVGIMNRFLKDVFDIDILLRQIVSQLAHVVSLLPVVFAVDDIILNT